MDLVWAVLPALALLACPLMMVFCLRGMRRTGGGSSCARGTTASAQTRGERIDVLERQLVALQDELATLRVEETAPPAAVEEALAPVAERPVPVAS